jgi:hypothetical protein
VLEVASEVGGIWRWHRDRGACYHVPGTDSSCVTLERPQSGRTSAVRYAIQPDVDDVHMEDRIGLQRSHRLNGRIESVCEVTEEALR